MSHVNDGRGITPASREQRAEQMRLMKERHQRENAEREAERERSRLSEIEYRKRWDEIYAAMNLDDIIEIPGRQGGENIVLRYRVGNGGRLIEVTE
jgi:hypothetical protein